MSWTYIERRCRKTGTRILLAAPGIEADAEEGWMTICLDHGGCAAHETRRLAEEWMAHPDVWCEDCEERPKVNSRVISKHGAAIKCTVLQIQDKPWSAP